ncbi:MAG: flagellar motor protein MotB [Lachnospiraceae bacterium]|nr:flagellar motor protein MotB [Lachnospiraceae bacterium]
MAKQKAPDKPPPGCPAWMGTWSDMMNLMMCFFVMLFALSSVDEAKFDIFVQAFSQSFSIFRNSGNIVDDGGFDLGNGVSQINDLANFIETVGLNPDGNATVEGLQGESPDELLEEATQVVDDAGLEASEEMAMMIAEALVDRNLDGFVDIELNAQYVLLRISGSILFDSGRTEIREEAERILRQVAPIVERYAMGTVQIEGHTDNVPMSSGGRYRNNDELSSGRAYSVYAHLLENSNLDPRRVVHAGRGEHNPIADNSSPSGRSMNRRVEIKLFNSVSSY